MHYSFINRCVGLGICPPSWLRQGFTAIGLKSAHAVGTHEIRANSFYIDSQLIYSVSGSQKPLLKAVF